MSTSRKTPTRRIRVGGSWRAEIRLESRPAIRAARSGSRLARAQNRIRKGPSGRERREARRAPRATRFGLKAAPVRAAS
jgi:hypothetical protein